MLIEFQAARERCTPFNGTAGEYLKSICCTLDSQQQIIEVAKADNKLVDIKKDFKKDLRLSKRIKYYLNQISYCCKLPPESSTNRN